ncbi:hypothetical protein LXL04_037615 [Taraxacum kok-saghyz]
MKVQAGKAVRQMIKKWSRWNQAEYRSSDDGISYTWDAQSNQALEEGEIDPNWESANMIIDGEKLDGHMQSPVTAPDDRSELKIKKDGSFNRQPTRPAGQSRSKTRKNGTRQIGSGNPASRAATEYRRPTIPPSPSFSSIGAIPAFLIPRRKLLEEQGKADFGALHKFFVTQPVDDDHVEEHIDDHVEEHIDEATSLAEKELSDFEFFLSAVIWHQVLNQVNVVSKRLQSKDIHLDTSISELNKLIEFFNDYRETGFSKAIDEAKEIASDMGVDPVFPQRRLIQRKKRSDIDAEELYMELKLFETLETSELSNSIDVLKYMKELDYFPNACIAYRILLTIPVTVASAERSFSKLKLLKSYLRSTMTQERLSGLATISIENEILESINYE